MSSEGTKLSGPDLGQGIGAADLADGSTLLGHAGGEPVLLVRRGREVFAVGATCTHYGGPLAEGLVTGDTVRCPWHHACFSLRTGEAVRAPALNAIPCYRVDQQDNRIVVLGKTPQGQSSSGASNAVQTPVDGMRRPDSVVIVGTGAAGAAAAETLRREGYDGPITMFGADAALPYDRPNLSKDYLAGSAPEEWIQIRPPEFYTEHRIDVRANVRAERIDVGASNVDRARAD